MKPKLKILLIVSPIIFLCDQLTKWLIVKNIPFGGRVIVWENFFDIVHVRNKGAAFGMLSGWDSPLRDVSFYLLAGAAVLFLGTFFYQASKDEKKTIVFLASIFGGALGNIMDRIFRGSVVDFLSFHWYNKSVNWQLFGASIEFDLTWPAFNVADSAITCGVICLLLVMMGQSRGQGTVDSRQ